MNNFVESAVIKTVNNIDREQLDLKVAQCSGFVKMMTGVANNCAILVARHSINKIADIRDKESYEKTPRHIHHGYKHKAKQAFNQFFNEWNAMERTLLYPPTTDTRFFHVGDMPQEAREKYGDMTDAEYFEFWKGTGALAFQRSLPLITSLQNKFRLSLERHQVKDAQQTAWAMVTDVVLQLAVETFERTMRSCQHELPMVYPSFIEQLWQAFSPKLVSDIWRNALLLLAPECDNYPLDHDEERNISLGLEQLRELWMASDLPFDATIMAVKDYGEDLFRNKTEVKKSIRELAHLRDEANKAL